VCVCVCVWKECTIFASPGVIEENRTCLIISRCSGCSLEKTFRQYKSGESHLGYYSLLGFLVLGIVAAGGKLFL
jgi:hypothetical protein